jgi:maltose alpha-D-glucosyltransferase/alpha-amylase
MQRVNTSSLFWIMKRIINMRKRFKAFGRGDMKFVTVANPKVLAFTRTYQDETLLVIVNLSKHSQAAEVDLSGFSGSVPVEVFSKNRFPIIKEDTPYFFTLGSHAYEWFLLEKKKTIADENMELPMLQLDKWEDLLTGKSLQQLQGSVLVKADR